MTLSSHEHASPTSAAPVPERRSFLDPFAHHVWPRMFPEELRQELQGALLASGDWTRTELPEYQYYVLNAAELGVRSGGVVRAVLDLLSSPDTCQAMCALTGVPDCGLLSLFSHDMRAGDSVGVHVDYNDWGDEFRLVIYLSHQGAFAGGKLRLHAADSAHTVRKIIPPDPGSAFLFRFAPGSYHSVTPVTGPDASRLSLVATYGRT